MRRLCFIGQQPSGVLVLGWGPSALDAADDATAADDAVSAAYAAEADAIAVGATNAADAGAEPL